MTDKERLVSEGLLRVEEAAAFLGFKRSQVYVLVSEGRIPSVKFGRSRRIPRRALIEIAAAHLEDANAIAG